MIASMLFTDPLYELPILFFVVVLMTIGRIFWKEDFKEPRIRYLIIVGGVALIVFNSLFGNINISGRHVLFYVPIGAEKYYITFEGVYFGIGAAERYIIMLFGLLTVLLTTYPRDLSNSLEKWKIPYFITYMLSLTFRFMPTIESEIRNIIDSQKSRGYDKFEKGNIKEKIIAYGRVFKIIVINALVIVERLSIILECRCFGASKKRSSRIDYVIRKNDYIVIGFSLFCLAASTVTRFVFGKGILEGF